MLSFNMNIKWRVFQKLNFTITPILQNWIGNNQINDYWLLTLAT